MTHRERLEEIYAQLDVIIERLTAMIPTQRNTPVTITLGLGSAIGGLTTAHAAIELLLNPGGD